MLSKLTYLSFFVSTKKDRVLFLQPLNNYIKVLSPDREDILEGTIRKVIQRVSKDHLPLVLTDKIPLAAIK